MKIRFDIGNNSVRTAKIFLIFALLFVGVAGCKDEGLMPEDPSNEKNTEETEGDCIQFVMKLDKDLSSRGSFEESYMTKYEDYIDTQDKMRIFFFNEDGDFLFGANDRVVGSLSNSDQNATYWYVRIPMTMIVDRENQEYDIDKIKKYLKNNNFKIAVLANWPNGGEKINPADYDDSEGTPDGNDNPSSTLKGNPHWTWSNSILNKDAKSEDIRNINDLHHLYNDSYYANQSRFPTYGMFMAEAKSGDEAGYYSGEPTDWVKMRDIDEGWHSPEGAAWVDVNKNGGFSSKNEANAWIRANWNPNVTINQSKAIYRHYQHMWFLWNFDASFKTGMINDNIDYLSNGGEKVKAGDPDIFTDPKNGRYTVVDVANAGAYTKNWGWKDRTDASDPVSEEFGKEWYKRNGDILYQWMKKSYNNGGTPNAIGEISIMIGEANNDVYLKYQAAPGEYAYCREVNGNYGIQLPAMGEGEKVSYDGTLQFQARTSGTLRIKWSSYDGTSSGLAVQVGLPKDAGEESTEAYYYHIHNNVSRTEPIDWTTADGLNYLDIAVGEGSRTVYISCTKGKAVVYSIEFIRGRYLYDTDREGVAPSGHQGIPMYGVQDFSKIDDWQRGTTITLSKNINLVRALAKVEVFIKKDFGEPKHVIMRCMNRAARCEPIDVHTPTDKIWISKHEYTGTDKDIADDNCEWFRIQKYGPTFEKVENGDYKSWLSWFYGSWKTDNNSEYPMHWKTDGTSVRYRYDVDKGYHVPVGTMKGWGDESMYSYTTNLEPPHIFNPYIYRSEFCNMIKINEETSDHGETYYKYVLFVPEKNIEDPTTVGNLASNPKVMHIEYRFPPDASISQVDDGLSAVEDDPYTNSEYNLDDNDCYRIYFTNYGGGTTVNGPVNEELKNQRWWKYTYDEYEKDGDRLTKHWPIMRNHKYRMFVGGSGPENPEIHVQVSDWGHRKVIVEW